LGGGNGKTGTGLNRRKEEGRKFTDPHRGEGERLYHGKKLMISLHVCRQGYSRSAGFNRRGNERKKVGHGATIFRQKLPMWGEKRKWPLKGKGEGRDRVRRWLRVGREEKDRGGRVAG